VATKAGESKGGRSGWMNAGPKGELNYSLGEKNWGRGTGGGENEGGRIE